MAKAIKRHPLTIQAAGVDQRDTPYTTHTNPIDANTSSAKCPTYDAARLIV
jgi:hypothetical protein